MEKYGQKRCFSLIECIYLRQGITLIYYLLNMRHIYTILLGMLLPFFSLRAQQCVLPQKKLQANYEEYSWTPLKGNYVATDIKGVKHDINAYLAEGKCVLIDFSATTCEPCWDLHRGGYLERYHNLFGPQGTDLQKLVVLWVEGTGASLQKIKDHNRDWTLQHNSVEEVSYPIISDAEMAAALGITMEYFPTIVLISPRAEYTELYQSDIFLSEPRLRTLIEACPVLPQAPTQVRAASIDFAYSGEQVVWTPYGNSILPITAYQWQFEGANIPSSEEKNPVVVWDKPGTYTVKLTLTNEMGSASTEQSYTVLDRGQIKFPLTIDAEEGTFPIGWRVWENDGDEKGWSNLKMELDRLNLTIPEGFKGGHNSRYCLVSWSFYPMSGKSAPNGGFNFKGVNVPAKNWLISPPIDIPKNATKATISFATNKFFASSADSYRLLASTRSLAAEDFTHELRAGVVTDSKEWKEETIDLLSLKGERVTLAFVHERKGSASSSAPGSSFLLDDIRVDLEYPTIALEEVEEVALRLYPTETADRVTIEKPRNAEVLVFDTTGRLHYQTKVLSEEVVLYVSDWSNGHYFVQVLTEEKGRSTRSFCVKH